MSLVGSLEDLGLADILQIMSLSRKSGTLHLRSGEGEGRIVFRDGLVHAATLKGDEKALPPPRGGGPEPSQGGLEHLEALRRERVERAVVQMFEWRSGEFSFEVSDDGGDASAAEALANGLSPQYLAMEATRRVDELRAGGAERADDGLRLSGEEPELPGPPAADADPLELLVHAALARAGAPEAAAAPPAPEPHERAACPQLVAIDPDLAALEWLKASLSGLFERIHLFQAAPGGIARIRQYLSRGELPAVLLAARAPMDPLSGIDTASELFRRLRAQAPRMPLVILGEEGSQRPRAAALADACAVRPTTAALQDAASASRVAAAARALRARLAPFARRDDTDGPVAGAPEAGA